MQIKQIVIIIIILFTIFKGSAQKNETKKEYSYNVPENAIVHTYFDKSSSSYLTNVISQTNSKIYIDGKLIKTLNSNEDFIGIENDQLYLSESFLKEKYKVISIYKITGAGISKFKSKQINHLEVNTRFIDGKLVVSDDIEGYGTVVEFFDDNLNSIISYYPFPEGYYSSEINIKNNIATVFSNALGINKITKFNLTTSQLIFEKDITIPSATVKKVYLLSDGLIAYCSTHDNQRIIIKFDDSGNVKWSNHQLLPMFHKGLGFFESVDNTELYFITKKTVISVFDSKSGKLLKEIDLKKINPNALNSKHTISSLVIKPNNELIVLSGDLDWDKVNVNTFQFSNNNIHSLNIADNIYSSKPINSNFKRPQLSFIDGSIVIKSEKKQELIVIKNEKTKKLYEER